MSDLRDMSKPIAIHKRDDGFSSSWIDYCLANAVPFKIVDCHRSDILDELQGCAALMWNFTQTHLEDLLIFRAIVHSAEEMGLRVFPDTRTSWHFDDKVAQKYLLEAVGARCVPSYVFVRKQDALDWLGSAAFPSVFKLRGGAGSSNVHLVVSKAAGRRLIEKAFARGFSSVPRFRALEERWWQFRRDQTIKSFINVGRGLARAVLPNPLLRRLPRQSGYAYFQDFIPDNDSDIRVIVIGERSFAIRRMVREGDFRASGSGLIFYNPDQIPSSCIRVAFDLADRLKTQCIALDFVLMNGEPLVVEMSYAFMASAYAPCPGYWLRDLSWIEETFVPEYFMIEDVLSSLRTETQCN